MKTIKRKLLSLLLAMAMVLTLVPTALATGDYTVTVEGNPTSTTIDGTISLTAKAKEGETDVSDGTYTWTLPETMEPAANYTVNSNPISIKAKNSSTATESVTGSVSCSFSKTVDGSEKTGSSTGTTVTFTYTAAQADISASGTVNGLVANGTAKSLTITVKEGQSPLASKQVSVTPSASTATGTTFKIGGTAVSGATTVTTGADGTFIVEITPGSTAGSGTISVSYNGKSAQVGFTVGAAQTSQSTVTLATAAGATSLAANTSLTMMVSTVTPELSSSAYDTITWTSSNSNILRVSAATTTSTSATLTGVSAGKATITVEYKKGSTVVAKGTSSEITVTGESRYISLTNISGFNTTNNTFTVVNGSARATAYDPSFPTSLSGWTFTWSSSNRSVVDIEGDNYYGTNNQSVILRAGVTGTATIRVDIVPPVGSGYTNTYLTTNVSVGYSHQINPTVTVSAYSSGYNMASVDDAGTKSVIDQIASQIPYGASYYSYASVRFSSTSISGFGRLTADYNKEYFIGNVPSSGYIYNYGLLSDIDFIPNSTTSTTTGGFEFTLTTYNTSGTTNSTTYTGLLTVKLTDTAATSGDINYTGSIGQDVYFDVSDFEDFYYSKTSGGSLNYVTFSTVSTGSGTLYGEGGRLSSGNTCYVSPTSRQTALDSVYFTPSGTTASKGGTVRLSFTAYGTRGSYNYSSTVSGTVVINYLNGSAKDITYTPTGSTVSLKASDFTDAYRQVMGSTAPSDLTIQFQDVPTYGSLSYKNSSSSSSSTVNLRSSNIKSYRFTTRTSGANQLADVTYTASGTRSDTIEYIAYASGVARFTGKVVFNPSAVSTTVLVNKSCGSTGVAFNLADFTMQNATVMANTSTVRFTIPSSGTLTFQGATVTYTGASVPVSMMSQVFYRPNAGFNGTDRVAFICYDASNNQVGSGQVNIVVSGNTGSTSTSGGVTSISQFVDLPAAGTPDAWYLTELADLVSKGIVQGTGNGKAEPRKTLNYGEALKMILRAAGYSAQQEPAGDDWAINYKNLAVQNGIVDSSIVLTAPISRDAVVEMAAKALKISPVTGGSPFTDSNNGYAIALNRTTPQIIVGNANGTFNGSGTLLRQEVWVIVYRMNQYVANQYSSVMPDGI